MTLFQHWLLSCPCWVSSSVLHQFDSRLGSWHHLHRCWRLHLSSSVLPEINCWISDVQPSCSSCAVCSHDKLGLYKCYPHCSNSSSQPAPTSRWKSKPATSLQYVGLCKWIPAPTSCWNSKSATSLQYIGLCKWIQINNNCTRGKEEKSALTARQLSDEGTDQYKRFYYDRSTWSQLDILHLDIQYILNHEFIYTWANIWKSKFKFYFYSHTSQPPLDYHWPFGLTWGKNTKYFNTSILLANFFLWQNIFCQMAHQRNFIVFWLC